jgi:Tol biopolymer transport system component
VSPSWSPNGGEIAFVRLTADRRKGTLMVVNVASGEVHQIAALNSLHGAHTTSLDWSPDGKWLAVLENLPGDIQAGVHLFSRTDSARRVLTRPKVRSNDMQPAFAPDGRRVAFVRDDTVSSGILVQKLNANMEPDGPARQVVYAATFPAWLPNGDLLFISSRGGSARLWRLPAAQVESPLSKPTPELLPAFGDNILQCATSRDGKRFMITRHMSNVDIFRYTRQRDGSTTGPEPFVSTMVDDFNPVVSPDGRQVAFISYRGGGNHLWLANADGTNVRRLSDEPGTEVVHWSPAGDQIYFTSRDQGVVRRLRYDLRTKETIRLPDYPFYMGFTPDGKWAFTDRDPERKVGLFRLAAPPAGRGGTFNPAVLRLTNVQAYHSALAPEGNYVYFTRARRGPVRLWRVPLDGSAPPEIFKAEIYAPWFVFTPEGLYFTKIRDPQQDFRLQDLYLDPLRAGVPERKLVSIPQPLALAKSLGASPDGMDLFLPVQLAEGVDLVLAVVH